MVTFTGQGQVKSNIHIEPGTQGVIGGAGEDGVRQYVGTRGGGYGLDADLAMKQAANYDHGAEAQVRRWIEELTEEKLVGGFGEALKDGVLLCKAINRIKPGTVKKINESSMPFKQMENVSSFLKGCRALGVPEHSLFETVDLYEQKDIGLVVQCAFALGGAVQASVPDFDGPRLGVAPRRSSHIESEPGVVQEEKQHIADEPVPYTSVEEEEAKCEEKEAEVSAAVEEQLKIAEEEDVAPPAVAKEEESEEKGEVPPASFPAAAKQESFGVFEGQGQVPSNIYIAPGTTGVIGGAGEDGRREYTGTRGGGYGMDADLSKKQAACYDHSAEAQARAWVEAVTKKSWQGSFASGLKDGVLLCELFNTIKPGSIAKVNTSAMPFKQMENVSAFLKASRALGVPEHSLFETVDLFEEKDISLVVKCLFALGGCVQKQVPSYNGPTLGVKESDKFQRSWTPEERRAMSRKNVGMTKMMEGSSGVMSRTEVLRTGITMAAEYSGTSLDSNCVPQLGMGSKDVMERPEVSKSNNITFGAEATSV